MAATLSYGGNSEELREGVVISSDWVELASNARRLPNQSPEHILTEWEALTVPLKRLESTCRQSLWRAEVTWQIFLRRYYSGCADNSSVRKKLARNHCVSRYLRTMTRYSEGVLGDRAKAETKCGVGQSRYGRGRDGLSKRRRSKRET